MSHSRSKPGITVVRRFQRRSEDWLHLIPVQPLVERDYFELRAQETVHHLWQLPAASHQLLETDRDIDLAEAVASREALRTCTHTRPPARSGTWVIDPSSCCA